MKQNLKLIGRIIGWIVFVFLIITFIIVIAKLPSNFDIQFDLKELRIDSNVSFSYMKKEVIYYYKELLKGSLGKGNKGIPVWKLVGIGFSKSIILLIGSLLISIVFGILKGIFDSRKEKQTTSTIRLLPTLIGLSMPDIFVIILIQSFVVWLHNHGIKYFPVAGYENLRHAILPMISLSIIPTMYIARITALTMDNIYDQEYIRTALGKGASRLRVIFIHVLRNAIVEIADSFSSIASILISSLLLVEYFFYYPGLTLIMYNNYEGGQTDVVIGVALIIGLIYFVIDSFFKLLRFFLNPKLNRE
jgi:ABC-type dipeptide/oligopeptide/nickel transport system permease component